jgi:cell division protein FtsA
MAEKTVAPHIVALDVGSSKITVLVCALDPDGGLRYVEAAHPPALGIAGGVITSIPEAAEALTCAVVEVEEKLQQRITHACVGVGGRHLAGQNMRGAVAITPRGREITPEDVARAIAAARSNLPRGENREVLHEIPRAYVVDGHPGIQDPHGMAGYELEVEVHCATGTATILHNVLKCIEQAGIRRDHVLVVASPLAAGEVAREAYGDQQPLAVLDIGLETAKLAVYVHGSIWLSEVLPLGGQEFTQALAAKLRLPFFAAEELKLRYGSCEPWGLGEAELVEMPPSIGIEAFVPRSEIALALHEQGTAFAAALRRRFNETRRAGVDPASLVLVGGGAELRGLDTLLAYELDMPVQVGVSMGIRGLPPVLDVPSFATAAGLAQWYARYASDDSSSGKPRVPRLVHGLRGIMRVVLP